jgi:hypothetical protein
LNSPKRKQDTALRPKPQVSEPTATSEEPDDGCSIHAGGGVMSETQKVGRMIQSGATKRRKYAAYVPSASFGRMILADSFWERNSTVILLIATVAVSVIGWWLLWLWRQKDKDSKHLDYRVIEDIPILAGGTTGPRS